LLKSFPRVVRALGKPPEAPARKAVWLASSATDGRTGLEVYLFNPATALVGFARESLRRLMGRPSPQPDPQLTKIPPAI
jgi:hypothetical protein